MKGAQFWDGGIWHMPMGLQNPGGIVVVPMQAPGLQAVPAASSEQVPAGIRLHDWQLPLQAVLQQTPSAQKPEVQALALVQAAPLGNPGPPPGKSTETTARPGRRRASATSMVSFSTSVTRTASLT